MDFKKNTLNQISAAIIEIAVCTFSEFKSWDFELKISGEVEADTTRLQGSFHGRERNDVIDG